MNTHTSIRHHVITMLMTHNYQTSVRLVVYSSHNLVVIQIEIISFLDDGTNGLR